MTSIFVGNLNLMYAGLIALLALISVVICYRKPYIHKIIRLCGIIQFGHLLISLSCLAVSFTTSDFNLKVVALNSESALHPLYKVAAMWSNHEGSLLLWLFVMGLCHAIFILQTLRIQDNVINLASLIQLLLIGVLSTSLYYSTNPFEILNQPLTKGLGLNPLLHDPSLVIHPPSLYFGFIGFTVPFSLAIAILFNVQKPLHYFNIVILRIWILAAFSLLTLGITLGSIWAYYELGWGGYWYWDPVETISFLPWLIALTTIHLIKSNDDTNKNIILICLTSIIIYLLILSGTYLTRSGIIASVHAFAYDPHCAIIFIILASIIAKVLGCFIIRNFKDIKLNLKFTNANIHLIHWQSLITIFYTGLLVLTLIIPVLFSTLYQKNIVIQPYFYIVATLPLVCLFLYLMINILAKKTKDSRQSLFKISNKNWLTFAILIFCVLSLVIADSFTKPLMILALLLSGILIIKSLQFLKSKRWEIGLSHLSFALIICGVTINHIWGYQQEIKLAPGQAMSTPQAIIKLDNVRYDQTAIYKYERAALTLEIPTLFDQTRKIKLFPEKRLYQANNSLVGKTAIHQNGLSHYYTALGGQYPDGKRSIFFGYYPLISLIWIGGFLLAFTTLIKAYQLNFRRYRLKAYSAASNL